MANKEIEVAVVGGGIGGLAAAISLLRAGFDVHVYEQSRAMREVGAGLQVSPNASRVLHRLGLADELAKLGVRSLAVHQRRWQDGRTLLKTPLADAVVNAFGYPHYQSHRGDVLAMLVAAFPSERLHTGHRLARFVHQSNCVEAEFDNGTNVTAGVLIGADGIHSTVRESLFGLASPHFTGCMAYRGLVPTDRIKHLDVEVNAQIWMGPGKHIVIYYVKPDRSEIYLVTSQPEPEFRIESWSVKGDVKELRAAFAGFSHEVERVLAACPDVHKWAILDRDSLPRWADGNVTLLGDACHPMTPYMAQGAAMAIEDAAVLSRCLDGVDAGGVADAFRRFEATRKERTTRVQETSRANTWLKQKTDTDWVYSYDAWTVPLAA